jgi:hypothetical protein
MLAIPVPDKILHAGAGTIEGIVKIIIRENQIAYGDWIRVLLLKEKATLPEYTDNSKLSKYERMDRIISAHMDFYKHVMEKVGDSDGLLASTLTRPDGTFKFADVSPGQYHVVITFPSMIKGYKVAWQVPVNLAAGETKRVILTNDNFALPTYCRE